MESKKINQLATELAPDLSDLTIIGDPTTGISKKITLSQMASLFTGTVEEYANFAAFPLVGVADTIYIALDTNILYRWNTGTSAYVELSPNIVSSLVFNDANGFDGTINLVGSVATLTITTALTTGSVGFIGASGALLQDNANFFWDDTNNRLGLGTNAPTTALDAFGSGIIGRLNGTSTNNAYLGFASAGTNKWSVGNVQSDHRFRIFSEANSAELITILQTGEFGIGIANPTTKLHIDGGASALIANLDANVSVAKSVSFRSDNSNRFNIEVSGTESGSNAGADLFIRRYSDAGSLIDTPLTITRSTGNATFSGILITPQVKAATSAGLSINANSGTQVADFGAGGSANITFFGGLSGTSATFSGALSSNSLTLTNALSVANGGTGASSFTSGSILFSNGTLIAQDNSNLFFDDTNNRLGIGTSSPGLNLSVQGLFGLPNTTGTQTVGIFRVQDSSSNIALDMGVVENVATWIQSGNKANSAVLPLILNPNGGNIGINTTSPADLLEVKGGFIRLSATSGNGPQFNLYSNGQTSNHVSLAQGFALATDNIGYLINRANADFVFGTNNTERLRIASTGAATFLGNVGITVADTPQLLLTHSNTSRTFLMAVDGSNAFFRANSTNNILFQIAGGTTALTITSAGSVQFSVPYSSGYHIDSTPAQIAVANGGTINFSNFSGMVVMNNHTSGGVTIYLMGAGMTTAVASNGTQVGTMAYNAGINGYTWTNNSGGTNIFGAAIIRTRITA